jgi:AcrR family transcriptional regulator
LPKTKEQFEEIRNKSKAAIIEAALELFANNGFHSTSITKIAKKAGVSKGLMYNYFNGKNELLEAVIMSAYEKNAEPFIEEMKQPNTPQEHLSHFIDMTKYMLKHKFRQYKLMMLLSFQEDANKIINAELMPKKEPLIQQFVLWFEEMGYEKAKEEAYLMSATLNGISLQYMMLGKEYPLDEMLQLMKDKYCK